MGELIYGLQQWEFYSYTEDLDFYYGYCGAFEDLATCVYDKSYYADDSDYDELIACSDYYSCDADGCLIYTYGEDIGYAAFGVQFSWEDLSNIVMDNGACSYGVMPGKVTCSFDSETSEYGCEAQYYYFSEDAPYTVDGYQTDDDGEYYYYQFYDSISMIVQSL